MSDDDRASRLRRRRQKARDRTNTSDADDSDDSSKPSVADDSATPSDSSEPAEPAEASVKDEQVGTYMYLPEWQKKELDRVYGLLKTQYEYEFDADFEKNRHFFPILVQHGLEELDGASAQDVRDYLVELNE